MPQITQIHKDELERCFEQGLINDEKLLKGLEAGLDKLDKQLNTWGGTKASIQSYEVLADEIERQGGVRIESQTATALASEYRRQAENLKKDLR